MAEVSMTFTFAPIKIDPKDPPPDDDEDDDDDDDGSDDDSESSTEEYSVTLSQADWDQKIGVMTKSVMYSFMEAVLTKGVFLNPMDCGISAGGEIETTITVSLSHPTIKFNLYTNHGTLGSLVKTDESTYECSLIIPKRDQTIDVLNHSETSTNVYDSVVYAVWTQFGSTMQGIVREVEHDNVAPG